MIKILFLTVLCITRYGTAIRDSNNNKQCICTDGTKFKTFPFNQNEDKFSFINSFFPKVNDNPFISFFDSLNAPKSTGTLLENFIKPLENLLQPTTNQNGLALLINNLLASTKDEQPKNLLSSIFTLPKIDLKLPEIKIRQDPVNENTPDTCSTIWPYITQMFNLVPKETKNPISLQVHNVPAATLPNNQIHNNINPNSNINSAVPETKHIYAELNLNNRLNHLKPHKTGATFNPQSSLSTNVNFALPNYNTGLNLMNGQANPLNFNAGFKVPNYNSGGMYNIGTGVRGPLANHYNLNGGLQLPNMNLGGGLNMNSNFKSPYLGANLNFPGAGQGLGLNSNMAQGYPSVNLGGVLNSGLNLNGGIGLNGGFNPNGGVNYGANGINWLSNFPKSDSIVVASPRSNLDVNAAIGGMVAGVTPAPAVTYPATTTPAYSTAAAYTGSVAGPSAITPAPNAEHGLQYAKKPDAITNVNVNTNIQENLNKDLHASVPQVRASMATTPV